MRLIMMGTGPFAVPTFQQLYEARHHVALLVSKLSFRADKATGERAYWKKSFPAARQTRARSGNPSSKIKPRLGKMNIQPGLLFIESR